MDELKQQAVVTLYRCACNHCDAAEQELRRLCGLYGANLNVQRVENDERMRGFAGWKTPIVSVNGIGISHYTMDVKAWEEAIRDGVAAKPSAIVGAVVDLDCYFRRGARPLGHDRCAEECLQAGSPIGLAAADGQAYLAVPDPGERAPYESLRGMAGREIRVMGEICLRGGLTAIVVRKVEGL
jgi:hypothetical protein